MLTCVQRILVSIDVASKAFVSWGLGCKVREQVASLPATWLIFARIASVSSVSMVVVFLEVSQARQLCMLINSLLWERSFLEVGKEVVCEVKAHKK